MQDQDDSTSPKFNLLSFSGGLVVWSVTTALSLTALLRQQGIATASGAWLEVSDLYHRTMHKILIGLPTLIGLSRPEFSPELTASMGLFAVAFAPFVITVLTEHSVRTPLNLLYCVMLVGTFLCVYVGVGFFGIQPPPTRSAETSMFVYLVIAIVLTVGLAAEGWRPSLYYAKNFAGAGIILTSLALTGFFGMNW